MSGAAKARTGSAKAKAGPPGPGLVVGPVPALVRVAGGLALAGVLARLMVPAVPLAHAGPLDLGGGNAWDWIIILPYLLVVGAAAVACLLGRLPRLGLAVLLPVGTAAIGLALRTGYLFGADRSSQDLPLGLGSSFLYDAGGGLVLLLLSHLLLAAAFLAAAVAWSRTGMEDEGGFDGWRPRFAVIGLLVGVLAGLSVGTADGNALTVGAAAPPLLEQDGLALLGGLLLAVAIAAWTTFAATLRPRLATAGVFAGLAAVLGTEGLARTLLAERSPAVGIGAGAITELLAAALLGALAVGAWRIPPRTAAPADA